MATLSAASRLREQTLAIPGTVLLTSAGRPDQVIRFSRLPEIIKSYRDTKLKEGKDLPIHTILNLDNGPDSECWRNTLREANAMARRDKPMPVPAPVAPSCKDEWALGPEDVPVIELNVVEVVSAHAPKVDAVPVKVEAARVENAAEVSPLPAKIDKRSKAYRDAQKALKSKEA